MDTIVDTSTVSTVSTVSTISSYLATLTPYLAPALILIAIGVLYYVYKKSYSEGFQTIKCDPGKEPRCFKRQIMYKNMCYSCNNGTFKDGQCIEDDGHISIPKQSSPECLRIGAVFA